MPHGERAALPNRVVAAPQLVAALGVTGGSPCSVHDSEDRAATRVAGFSIKCVLGDGQDAAVAADDQSRALGSCRRVDRKVQLVKELRLGEPHRRENENRVRLSDPPTKRCDPLPAPLCWSTVTARVEGSTLIATDGPPRPTNSHPPCGSLGTSGWVSSIIRHSSMASHGPPTSRNNCCASTPSSPASSTAASSRSSIRPPRITDRVAEKQANVGQCVITTEVRRPAQPLRPRPGPRDRQTASSHRAAVTAAASGDPCVGPVLRLEPIR